MIYCNRSVAALGFSITWDLYTVRGAVHPMSRHEVIAVRMSLTAGFCTQFECYLQELAKLTDISRSFI